MTHPKSDKQAPNPARPASAWRRVPSEWPLLIYPVLFLTTLAILYVVNRSIQQESPTLPEPGTTAPTDAQGMDKTKLSGHNPRYALPQSPKAPRTGADQTQTAQNDQAASKPDRTPAVAGKIPYAVDLSRLKGAAKSVAMLRIAVEEKDRTLIKQSLAELVALGDAAVGPLNDLIRKEGETALWAATALARIGTPSAASGLLDRLSQTPEGTYKEELSKRISSVSNHESWPLLLDTMMQASDTTVVRAAGTALSGMADAPVLDEVIARYDAAATEAEAERLAQLVRNVRSPKATESLLSLAGNASAPPQDGLQEAAITALATIGNAPSVSYLLQRLEASPPGESASIFNMITQIHSPEAETPLLYAAAGNKEVSAEHGQTAAIYALKNYPDEQTVALLQRLVAQEQNEKVLTAATRTLEDIQQSPRAVTASADSLQKSEQMLPLKLVEK
jgi:hypothetical protein